MRNVKVLACFFCAIEGIYLSKFDVGGAATKAVLGLAAVDRGKVAVVSARPLARLSLRVGRAVGVEAVSVHVVSSTPAMAAFFLRQALVDARWPGRAAVGQLPVHRGGAAIGG